MAIACGVDFGTSNSTVGWIGERAPALGDPASALLTLEDGKPTLPSVVFFNAEDEEVSYGRAALAGYLAGYEGRLMRSLKSLLGTSLIDGQTEVAGRSLPFRMLLAQFIGEVKRRAELAAGREFTSAVFGRPVYFIDDNPVADQLAEDTLAEVARSVGFQHVAFQYEPIAAAFDYESHISQEELVLIADIGGGTSDFSLVRLSPQRALKADRRDDILATGGVHIGGTDFDKQLSLAGMMPLFGYGSRMKSGAYMPTSHHMNLATWHTINSVYSQKSQLSLGSMRYDIEDTGGIDRLFKLIEQRAGHWLAMEIEQTKIELTHNDSRHVPLDRVEAGLSVNLSRAMFEESIDNQLERIRNSVTQLLGNAGVGVEQVDTVFFTGGSSGIPALRQSVAAMLPNAQHVEGNIFGSIGSGLAIEAKKRYG